MRAFAEASDLEIRAEGCRVHVLQIRREPPHGNSDRLRCQRIAILRLRAPERNAVICAEREVPLRRRRDFDRHADIGVAGRRDAARQITREIQLERLILFCALNVQCGGRDTELGRLVKQRAVGRSHRNRAHCALNARQIEAGRRFAGSLEAKRQALAPQHFDFVIHFLRLDGQPLVTQRNRIAVRIVIHHGSLAREALGRVRSRNADADRRDASHFGLGTADLNRVGAQSNRPDFVALARLAVLVRVERKCLILHILGRNAHHARARRRRTADQIAVAHHFDRDRHGARNIVEVLEIHARMKIIRLNFIGVPRPDLIADCDGLRILQAVGLAGASQHTAVQHIERHCLGPHHLGVRDIDQQHPDHIAHQQGNQLKAPITEYFLFHASLFPSGNPSR